MRCPQVLPILAALAIATAAGAAEPSPTPPAGGAIVPVERIDPGLPDLHAAVFRALRGRDAPDELRWHPSRYKPDAEAFDVTNAGVPAPAVPAPEPKAPPLKAEPPAAVAQPPAPAVPPAAPPPPAKAVTDVQPQGGLERQVDAVRREATLPAPPASASPPSPPKAPRPAQRVAGGGNCSVHSNDPDSRARLQACIRAALQVSDSLSAGR